MTIFGRRRSYNTTRNAVGCRVRFHTTSSHEEILGLGGSGEILDRLGADLVYGGGGDDLL